MLEGLEKLDNKDTLERGAEQLREVLEGLSGHDDLAWFVRTLFSDRAPLLQARARREQLLLLPAAVRHFGPEVVSRGMLQERVLPLLVATLARGGDAHEAVARAMSEIIEHLLPDSTPQNQGGFLEVCAVVLDALLKPLQCGTAWDVIVKQHCILVLGALTPMVLRKARQYQQDPQVDLYLQRYATQLMQALTAQPGAQEGILQCLAHVAADRPASIAVHAGRLVEICVLHLSETPSAKPQFAPLPTCEAEDRPPKRNGTLTRELALMCCLCLRHLAEDGDPSISMPLGRMRTRTSGASIMRKWLMP